MRLRRGNPFDRDRLQPVTEAQDDEALRQGSVLLRALAVDGVARAEAAGVFCRHMSLYNATCGARPPGSGQAI